MKKHEYAWDDLDALDDLSAESLPDESDDIPIEVTPTPSPLTKVDLAIFFGRDGPIAQHLADYELRPSQLAMAEAVKAAILSEQHALIEAPTGTGKSIAYLIPAILSGKTVVVATANKSLQSQLYYKDIPFLRQVLGKAISAVIVKGRSNFVCTHKWEEELVEQQRMSLYDREHDQITFLRTWLNETETGDIDDLPFVLDNDLRPRLVSYPDDCLHQDCRFYDSACWVNQMRDQAMQAQILVTNHHLLLNALELGYAGQRLLPPAAIYVIDEAHGLEQTATAVYETTVTDYTVEQLLGRAVYKQNLGEDLLDEVRMLNTLAFQEVAHLSRENSYRVEPDLEEMKKLSRALSNLAQRMKQNSPFAKKDPLIESARKEKEEPSEERKIYELGIEALNSTASKLLTVAVARHDQEIVRYANRLFDRRHITLELHAAPINPAGLLRQFLFHAEDETGNPLARTVICTSATLATNGHFEHFKARCGITAVGEERVLPAVFDYPRQALLYQPPLPAYDWRNADAYYSAVAAEIERLLEVSRGRALCLFTSWSGLQQVYDRLNSGIRNTEYGTRNTEYGKRKTPHATLATPHSVWPLRAQGDAPRDALLTWFRETPNSVLLATRSFWEGVDIPGDNLSLVVLDKMPFPTPGDPLHSARMAAIDAGGGSSFGQYMTPLMTLALKQGFGRLIRRAADRGVVAILDERLSSKGYGRLARNDLPPARFSREFKDVHRFFQSALLTQSEFALNVWAEELQGASGNWQVADKDSTRNSQPATRNSIRWRWQALRLQDGKADSQEGIAELPDVAAGEIHAATLGLQDLRQRIERAGRQVSQFSVEVRCSEGMATAVDNGEQAESLIQLWQIERQHWQSVKLLTLIR
jgi:ATP-dependent DNA helicase DinG